MKKKHQGKVLQAPVDGTPPRNRFEDPIDVVPSSA